jgi:selenide,water dikinase
MGILPAGMYRNRSFAEAWVDTGSVETELTDLMYDPQTSGGLLISVAPEAAETLFKELSACVPSARIIGKVTEYENGKRIFLE